MRTDLPPLVIPAGEWKSMSFDPAATQVAVVDDGGTPLVVIGDPRHPRDDFGFTEAEARQVRDYLNEVLGP